MDPNVVLIVMDTARAADTFRVARSGDNSALRALADEGARFENAFTTSPWTLPAHAPLFTGQYPSRHGADAHTKQLQSTTPPWPSDSARSGRTRRVHQQRVDH